MSVSEDNAAERKAYWPVPVVRAIPAAGLALAITFSADHSAGLGLLAFGLFALVSGIVLGILSWLRLASSGARAFLVAQSVVSAVAGILALLLMGSSIGVFFLLVTAFAVITGFLELYVGLRTRRKFVASTDWLVVGVLTILAALAFLLVPPDLNQAVRTPDGKGGILDASVVAVGLLGAYGAILAIYLLIAGFSAKWGTQAIAQTAPASAPASPDLEPKTKGGTAA